MAFLPPRRAVLIAGTLGGAVALSSADAQSGAPLPPPPRVTLTPAAPVARPVSPYVPLVAARAPQPAQIAAGRPAWADRLVIEAEYAHLGAGPINRQAGRSMDATAGYDLRASGAHDGSGPRLELGWLRAARPLATAQGVTAGVSFGIPVPHTGDRLTVRPGLSALAGWAESQGQTWYYDWRGLPTTGYAGQTGTVYRAQPARSTGFGIGAALGASLRVARGAALMGAVRPWKFSGTAAAPLHGVTTLAAVGLSVRPADWHRARHDAPSAGVQP